MRLCVVTVGSRGDVQPYIALGVGLQRAGHRVRIITDPLFEGFIRQHGLDFAPVHADPQKALQVDIKKIGGNMFRLLRWMQDQMRPVIQQASQEVLQATEDAEALLFSSLSFPVVSVAEARRIPTVAAYLQPVNPTRAFPSAGAVELSKKTPAFLRGTVNLWSARLASVLYFRTIGLPLNEFRRNPLGLPPLPWNYFLTKETANRPVVYGYSRHVLPRPADWPEWFYLTGFWRLEQEQDWQPPPEVEAFLSSGSKPVYVGFGSMVDKDAGMMTDLVVESLRLSGQRAVLLGGWSGLGGGGLPETILRVDSIPHEWLFPRMAAVVHHGGIGTTAAGLTAGVPTVTVPFFSDQPFWAEQVHKLGVGPQPVPRQKLTAERLARAIEAAISDREIQRGAAALGEKLRAENGVAEAVKVIERLI